MLPPEEFGHELALFGPWHAFHFLFSAEGLEPAEKAFGGIGGYSNSFPVQGSFATELALSMIDRPMDIAGR